MTGEDRAKTLRQERKRFFWKIEGDLLFSDAFKEIARDGQTVMTYILILARQPIPPNKKDRLRLEKAGLWPPKDTSWSFPVREAPYHGLTVKGLSYGLKRLHEVGFIDRLKSGSALKGDFALYRLSNRWRSFGKQAFEALPWPKADTIGRRGEDGKFIRRRGRKNLVVAFSTTTKAPLMANPTTTTPPVVAESAINTCGKLRSVVAESAMLLSSPSPDVNLGEVKKVKKKVPGKEVSNSGQSRRDDAATSPKTWRPPRSEMQENVVEILRQRPDDRADDWRFIRFITDQLQAVQRGRLDRGRVWRGMVQQHDLDEWTADLLFAVAVIDIPNRGRATN